MNIFEIITGTPIWVWAVFIYIIISGIALSRPRISSLGKLTITPMIFISWSIYSILNKCTNCPELLFFWMIALIAGIPCGYYIMKKLNFRIDHATKLIHLPVVWCHCY